MYAGELVYFVPFIYIEDTPGGRVNDTAYLVTGGGVVGSGVTPPPSLNKAYEGVMLHHLAMKIQL